MGPNPCLITVYFTPFLKLFANLHNFLIYVLSLYVKRSLTGFIASTYLFFYAKLIFDFRPLFRNKTTAQNKVLVYLRVLYNYNHKQSLLSSTKLAGCFAKQQRQKKISVISELNSHTIGPVLV